MTSYTSSINPNLPAMDAPIASAPVRSNFAAAYSDINNIYNLIAAIPTAQGTVTSVSGVNANGITWSIANPTTSANITISLGAITPSSVNGITLSGSSSPSLAITGTSSISGSNTGDQTVALTGDVTGSGTGSFATTLKTVNSNVGTYTNATVTVNAKGLITAASSGGAPSTPFGDITSGTNTAQTLVIGEGSTLSTSGNGTITATTNANSTGVITSVGNITSTGAQTGTGSTFVMNQSPTINEPVIIDGNLGTPSQITLTNANGTATNLTAGKVSTINGLISAGNNVTITGSGTQASPYSIASTGGGSSTLAYSTFTSTASTTGTEQVVEITSGTFTLTLTSPTVSAGKAWSTYFKNSGSGTVTLSAMMDSYSSWPLSAGESIILVFNGTKWLVF